MNEQMSIVVCSFRAVSIHSTIRATCLLYIAPLYLYEENSAGEFKLESSCKPNWTNSFNEFLKNYLSDNPREILNYIYAILYCPIYRENYKEDISLSSAADKANISSVYLSRLFKKEEGINFLDYLNQYRIDEAKKMLKDVQYNILDVADESGFNNTRYFSKIFKKNVGITPSEYRKRHLGRDEQDEKEK